MIYRLGHGALSDKGALIKSLMVLAPPEHFSDTLSYGLIPRAIASVGSNSSAPRGVKTAITCRSR
jgi:hypothetical protein